MGRVGAFTIALTLVACTVGPVQHGGGMNPARDVAGVAAPDALLIDVPESLLHLSERDLRATMGDPAFVWVESDAQMWRYDAATCALFVFLYPDGVRHVDLQGDGLDDAGRFACFRELVDRRL